MTNADESFEEDYSEYDEFDDDEERGLSGFSVLVIGLVMIGAFISVVWIAYQQGMKRNADGLAQGTPYVAAEPEPIKIENQGDTKTAEDREVYDVFDGENSEPATVLAEGPEEPLDRGAEDAIAAIARDADETANDVGAPAQNRTASLAEEDADRLDPAPEDDPAPTRAEATRPTAANATADDVINGAGPALTGTHVVQVGAFKSDSEAEAQWSRLQSRLGDYVAGKAIDIERADKGSEGVYYRLRVGPFSSSADAKQYCVGLKERGQDCLIKSL